MALAEEDIKQLVARRTETKNLDYKQSMNWETSSKDEKASIVKDILAMINTQDGGRIIFGVRNEDFELTGVTSEDLKSWDPTKVNDFLHKYADPLHSCVVYKVDIEGKHVVAVDVPEFSEIPIVCKKDCHSAVDSSEHILKKGQIYIRTDKATSEGISSPEQTRELLGRALAKKGDELLGLIQRLIQGRPLKGSEESSRDYEKETRDAEDFFSRTIGDELQNRGHWAVYARPVRYEPRRIADQKRIKEILERSQVRLRGWYFPHIDPNELSNFGQGTQCHIIWDRFREGFRAYRSGFFFAKKAFWEDVEQRKSQDGKPVLSFVYAIWLLTEFFLFFKRYYEAFAPDEDIIVKIVLSRTLDRKLASFDPLISLHGWHICKEDSIAIEENIKVVDLRASYKEIANRVIREVFTVFNWDTVSEKVVDDWQKKLIEGKA